MSANDNPVLSLQPNTVYVAINPILQGYHWSMFIVDAQGVATRHHWSEVTRPRGDFTSPVERYSCGIINPVRVYSNANNCYLAFFRITGYVAPNAGFNFPQFFSQIYPTSFANTKANRDNNISCDLWVLNALQLLQTNGMIVRPQNVAEVTQMAIMYRAQGLEQLLRQRYAEGNTYISALIDV